MFDFIRTPQWFWSILRGDRAAVVASYPYLLAGGITGMLIASLTDGPGILIGFFAASLGAAGGSLKEWRAERGLWMLAVLFFFIYGFIYVCFCVAQVRDALPGAPQNDVPLMFELLIATFVLAANLRFLVAVAKENYVFSASSHDA